MGIPSYFSYIVRNHSEIIKRFTVAAFINGVQNLYLDCNSIIYDSVYNIDFSMLNESASRAIISRVILKIEEYMDTIKPQHTVIIAFDGVAPVAKLEQQRNRRYKSWYQSAMTKSIYKNKKSDTWNTAAITPGTVFMSELNKLIHKHFTTTKKYKNEFIVSTSDEHGEGEHKIFQYIRDHKDKHMTETTVIYGLDADLIMLSINHLPICSNIYLFRETPEFIKSIDSSLEPNSTYFLDIPVLAQIIIDDMNNGNKTETDADQYRVYDYIFLCFFLGNDFMPHFPAVNIRTGGVDKMINAYKATIGGTNANLTNGKIIYWKNVRKMVDFLANQEEDMLKAEYKLRDRREKQHYPTNTPEQKYAKFDAIPNYERELEKYINPYKHHWKERYYNTLLKMDYDDERIKQICINYMQALEWTMKYYTTGCADWRWYYQHNYPPLLCDLIRFMPYFDTEFVKQQKELPVSPLVQLCYVLPRNSLQMLPSKLATLLQTEYSEWYPTDAEFMWAFCKYFWESHVELPEIEIDDLETLVHKTITAH